MVGPRASFILPAIQSDPTIGTRRIELPPRLKITWIGGSATILPGVTIGKMLLSLLVLWLQKDARRNTIVEVIQLSFAKLMKHQQFWTEKQRQ